MTLEGDRVIQVLKKSFSPTIAVILLTTMAVCALEAGTIRVGKYAGEFMAVGVGGRQLGLGGASTALANDVTAGYWNPAGLARINYPEFALMHDERFGSLVNYDYGAVAIPYGANDSSTFNASTFALSVFRLGVDGIPDTRNAWPDSNGNGLFDEQNARPDINQITFFNAVDWAMYLSYGKQSSSTIYYGASLKLIRRNIGSDHGTGFGFDVGALYVPYNNLSLGAAIQDVTTTLVAWSTGTNELISPTVKLGAAYMAQIFSGTVTPTADADIRFEGRAYSAMMHLGPMSVDVHGGLEYDFKNTVAIRVGYNEIGNLTLGAGVHLRKLDIDYSFAKFNGDDQLGNSHRISIRLRLEEDRFKRGGL
jgi:hypothetical protein